MLIGIVADIHDAVAPLRHALSIFQERRVERIVTLGDAFDSCQPGEPGPGVAGLLRDAGAIGVWGNHDFGLSCQVEPELRARADPTLLLFASQLEPQLVLGECRFSHVEPWKDASRVLDLWSFEGVPDSVRTVQRCFQAAPERILFVGHFHCRLVLRADGPVPWEEEQPIKLEPPDRYLVVIPAVLDGWCAMFDTLQSELAVIRCADG